MVTDGCGTGVAGVVSQGKDWHMADVAAFFSTKLNSAQQNYPVHEIEMLAGVETMLWYHDILQEVKFKWYTDHKDLVHLLQQKNLFECQAQWMEKIAKFEFEVMYVPGTETILSDALSCLYTYDKLETVRAWSKYMYHDIIDNNLLGMPLISMPLLIGVEGENAGVLAASLLTRAEVGHPQTLASGFSSFLYSVLAHSLAIPLSAVEPEPSCSVGSLAGMSDQDDVLVSALDRISTSKTSGLLSVLVPEKSHCGCVKQAVPPAETGRPEMAAEFAACTACRFIVTGCYS